MDSKIPKNSFKTIQSYIRNHFYLHIIDKKDIEENCIWKEEETKIKLIQSEMDAQKKHKQKDTEDYTNQESYKLIDFEEDTGSYSLLESIIIVSAYIASRNPEATDLDKFGDSKVEKTIKRNKNQGGGTGGRNKIGKTKRFTMDWLLAIIDYFLNLKARQSFETQNLNHSSSVYAKINTLARDKILKWS